MELICKVKNYDWGKIGSQSKVAQLVSNVNEDFKVDESLPYAELWMGTHINGPSVLKASGQSLECYVKQHPEYLGEEVISTFSNELPFLFKVLSINKSLSIQAHPSKEHAEELHAKYPDIYKDPNHKPEMAIALTPFEALCGFREMCEIRAFIEDIPELRAVVGCLECCQCTCDDIEYLKKAFKAVLTCSKEKMTDALQTLLKRFKTLGEHEREYYMADLVERLNKDFPNDNGIMMVYFLNYMKLRRGECIFLVQNEPHAYISGDCMENMACSDNVVRAGLTPKFVDVETLCSMLTYQCGKASSKIFRPSDESQYSKLFDPPVKDFAVGQYRIPAYAKNYKTLSRNSASILLIIQGGAKYNKVELKPGTTLFLKAHEVLEVCDIVEDLLMYQAFANV